jgi:hypothetical protein
MKSNAIVEPVLCPSICHRDLLDRPTQPIRPWIFQRRHVGIFCRKSEIAGEHQRRSAINGDLQCRSGRCRRASDLVESLEQFFAIQSLGHVTSGL